MRTVYFFAGLLTLQLGQAQPLQAAGDFHPGQMAETAPPELMHWGKIVGQWSCTEDSLSPDGSDWQRTGTSDWDFMWAYDGWGIQDNYFSPARSEILADESKRQRGINLRIYNPSEEKWILTWLTTQSKLPLSITAISDDEKIIMSSVSPNAQGQHTRTTFFDMTTSSFEWKTELSKNKTSWQEVYRIHCSLKNNPGN